MDLTQLILKWSGATGGDAYNKCYEVNECIIV